MICQCAWKNVFRSCMGVYWQLQAHTGLSECRRSRYGMPALDYICDIELAAKRYLSVRQLRIFRLYYLQGREGADCAAALGMTRGSLFHEVLKVAVTLGKAFSEKALFPAYEYLNY